MDKFSTHSGIAVPLRRSNVDTDQIIPAVYLKRVSRSGFEDGLFSAWRADPAFVLNQSAYQSGSVLIAGPDFGTGSSREHACWALLDYGFKVVVSARFGDIFKSNAGKSGLLTALVTEEEADQLMTMAQRHPGAVATVDLAAKTISMDDQVFNFEIDDYTRYRLLNGLDDISLTLQHQADIAAFESRRPAFKPTTTP
ncbi:MAG: 3-isopropylmalate dehydratase small subunit [Propionibacteriaceae bacterium]|jgi:3-isopropylmalate/(R)-2-methylmalate dehydratase small subunit|nr:3-isopropylmalate dehydratase small subunit [Propionibacteriaceae bacterium]